MGSQFIHVESYGRELAKGKKSANTVGSIVGEAERDEGQCYHVKDPKKPDLLYGVSFREAGEEAIKWADSMKDARGHKLRKDALCMVAGVISAPEDLNDWDKYKKDAIKWLHKKYGKSLKSVIEHTDENHKHIHFAVVAEPKKRFETIHQGYHAQRIADPKRGNRNRSKEDKVIGRRFGIRAYQEAMRDYQDDFYKSVSRKYGLTRIGPARRRLTRAEWKLEQAQAVRIAENLEQLQRERVQIIDVAGKVKARSKVVEEAHKEDVVVIYNFIKQQFEGLTDKQRDECWNTFVAKTNEFRSVNIQEKTQKKGISR